MRLIRLPLLAISLCFGIVASAEAIQPPPGFEDKTVKDLLPLLDNPSAEIREKATAGISWQLGRNEFSLTNVEPTVVAATLEKTTSLFKHEENRAVRIGCVAILLGLNSWTNTFPAIVQTTGDKDYLVRVRAISALLYVTNARHEQVPSIVLSRLEDCLKSSDIETLWQAALAAGETKEQRFLPLLQRLLKSPSPKVSRYASEAITKIEGNSPRSSADSK